MASLLSGLPRDERWESINLRALSLAGQVIAIVLVVAFLVTQFGGGDATTYAQLGVRTSSGWPGTGGGRESCSNLATRLIWSAYATRIMSAW